MDDDLLRAYDKELSQLRRAGAEFARAHPKIAGRLRMGADQVEDPHVSRLIESVAFLNARIRRKLDDDFPELTDAILGVLAPHYLSPLPSVSIARFECAADMTEPAFIEARSGLITDSAYGEACRYRTVYDVETWPILVHSARLMGPPLSGPPTPKSVGSAGLLHVLMRPADDSGSIGDLAPNRLRFFLNGEFRHMTALYELILNDCVEVAVGSSTTDRSAQVLGPGCIRPVGFEESESILPESSRSHPGHRLLSEYFAYPQKFLFFDVRGLRTDHLTDELHLFFYLKRSTPELEGVVRDTTLALGCSPIVNLFHRKAEPIRLTGTQSEYHLVGDARHQVETEIFSVDQVEASSSKDGRVEYAPFFGLGHKLSSSGMERYWHCVRRATPRGQDELDPGTELYVSVVDEDFESRAPDDWVLECDVTCLNRNQPAQLPYGGGHPRLSFLKGGGAITSITCLTPPSQTVRPSRGRGALWRLVSFLALNHSSLTDGEQATEYLRECLRLFDPVAAPETRSIPEALVEVKSKVVVRRIDAGGQPGFCRGLQVQVKLDEERLRSTGLFLLASVLERFLAGYCTINSFVETAVTTVNGDGELRRWAPRSGNRILV